MEGLSCTSAGNLLSSGTFASGCLRPNAILSYFRLMNVDSPSIVSLHTCLALPFLRTYAICLLVGMSHHFVLTKLKDCQRLNSFFPATETRITLTYNSFLNCVVNA